MLDFIELCVIQFAVTLYILVMVVSYFSIVDIIYNVLCYVFQDQQKPLSKSLQRGEDPSFDQVSLSAHFTLKSAQLHIG